MWERPSGSESAALPGEMNCFKSSILLEFWDIFIGKHAARESWMTAKPLWGTLKGGPNLSIPTSFAELQAIDMYFRSRDLSESDQWRIDITWYNM